MRHKNCISACNTTFSTARSQGIDQIVEPARCRLHPVHPIQIAPLMLCTLLDASSRLLAPELKTNKSHPTGGSRRAAPGAGPAPSKFRARRCCSWADPAGRPAALYTESPGQTACIYSTSGRRGARSSRTSGPSTCFRQERGRRQSTPACASSGQAEPSRSPAFSATNKNEEATAPQALPKASKPDTAPTHHTKQPVWRRDKFGAQWSRSVYRWAW